MAAADLLRLIMPPDAAWMLSRRGVSEQACVVRQLIRGATESAARSLRCPNLSCSRPSQRRPYWMGALEELRRDLTAFVRAEQLARRTPALSRQVQYAIVLDGLLRRPISGSRVRNGTGLAGQLLFAHLHRHSCLHWTDNELTIA
jgi:hypothetical protein